MGTFESKIAAENYVKWSGREGCVLEKCYFSRNADIYTVYARIKYQEGINIATDNL
jgi:hypothetical protein